MARKTLLDVISPIMAGPSSSHTAGAVRIGLMAREIFGTNIKKVQFRLYNSFATTGKGHGTDKALLAGLLGLEVDSTRIKNIFDENLDIDYSFEYIEDSNKHPNAVRIIINDEMTIRGESVGSGEIRITNINGFNVKITGKYHSILMIYKDVPGMISKVSNLIQKENINIASLFCDRDIKGGNASMYIAMDSEFNNEIIETIKNFKHVYFAAGIRKLKS